eukprot:13855745-Alexandrium_andersonii.AAC.1
MGVHAGRPETRMCWSLPATAPSLRIQPAGISRSPTSRSAVTRAYLGPLKSAGSSCPNPRRRS